MYRFAVFLAALPSVAIADDFVLTSRLTEATIYSQGAQVKRGAPFSVPVGTHRLIVADLPVSTPHETLRIAAEGLRLGALTVRETATPPRPDSETGALAAANAKVEQLETQVRLGEDAVAEIRLRAEAAQVRLDFLRRITADARFSAAEPLREVGTMIGADALAALQSAHTARIEAREADRGLKDLREALEEARRERDALVPEEEERLYVAISVTADTPTEGVLQLTYLTGEAGWAPVYDIALTREPKPVMSIDRGALVQQNTGENWSGVALTLSTARPNEQTSPSSVPPWIRRIEDPMPPVPAPSARSQGFSAEAMMDQPVIEPAIIANEKAVASFDGPAVTYRAPSAVDLATGADAVRIALDTLELEAEVFARATPIYDNTAFLVAAFTNSSAEPIQSAETVSVFLDGTLVGISWQDPIPAGAEAEVAFGPIEALRLSRVVESRNAGDRGVLTRSNTEAETVRIEVENLGDLAWPIRLQDRIPVTQQEDLEINWRADPMPTEQDVDDRPGVMEWRFDAVPDVTRTIRIYHDIKWPDGKVLR